MQFITAWNVVRLEGEAETELGITVSIADPTIVADSGGPATYEGDSGLEEGTYRLACLRAGSTTVSFRLTRTNGRGGSIEAVDNILVTCLAPQIDPIEDWYFSNSQFLPGLQAAYGDIVKFGYGVVDITPEQLAEIADGEDNDIALSNPTFVHRRPDGAPPFGPGKHVVAGMEVAGEIPTSQPNNQLVYAAVFDSDGRTENNWQFVEPFDWDIYQGSDKWFELKYDPATNDWFVDVTEVLDDQTRMKLVGAPTDFQLVGDKVFVTVAASAFPSETPLARVSAFVTNNINPFAPDTSGADNDGAGPTNGLFPIEF